MAKKAGKNHVKIIGRQSEQRVLQKVLNSKTAEFLALYGRRRIGKTYLIINPRDQQVTKIF